MEKVIKIENLVKKFKNHTVINDLSIQVKQGEIYGLLGSNGAGKSTTINILLGFINSDSGRSTIKGIDTVSNFKETRKITGYISENVNLYPYLSGIENLDYFCKLNGKNYNYDKLEQILNHCGLEKNDFYKMTSTYSKGMRQKVGIAIALAKDAEVYLLDEPASGLDPLASNDLSSLLRKLSSEGSTILMASHDIFRVCETCDRIGIIKNGSIVKEITASEVSTDQLEKIYINYMKN